MIDGVLSYSKLGAEEEATEKVDLQEIIDNIKIDLEVLISNKSAVITTTNLPSFYAHPTLVYQLFYNLILNSLKFSKVDEPSKIEIISSEIKTENGSLLQIQVKDNGIGFVQEKSEAIFHTFIRLNAADHYEGSGLGLALCKKIVERYNGTIMATAIPDKGAIFTIILPIVLKI